MGAQTMKEQRKTLETQTIIFSKKQFPTRQSAKSWASNHGFKTDTSRETTGTWRFRQFPPEECIGTKFLSKKIEDGITIGICTKRSK
jgi:hypothetical protein